MPDPGWISTIVVAVFGGGGLWVYLSDRRKSAEAAPAAILASQAAFQLALNTQSEAFITAQRLTIKGLEDRIDELERDNARCRGEAAELQARISGLERILREAGIAIPKRPPANSLTVIEDGVSTQIEFGHAAPAKRTRRKKET